MTPDRVSKGKTPRWHLLYFVLAGGRERIFAERAGAL